MPKIKIDNFKMCVCFFFTYRSLLKLILVRFTNLNLSRIIKPYSNDSITSDLKLTISCGICLISFSYLKYLSSLDYTLIPEPSSQSHISLPAFRSVRYFFNSTQRSSPSNIHCLVSSMHRTEIILVRKSFYWFMKQKLTHFVSNNSNFSVFHIFFENKKKSENS